MADAVTTRVLLEDDHQYGVFLGSVSDATGESAVIKITFANLTKIQSPVTRLPIAPIALDLAEIWWNVVTFTSVDLFWKATTPDRIIRLLPTGYGHIQFTGRGTLVGDTISSACAQDPLSSGHTGDITLTSSATAGGVYNIVLWFRKRYA
jgi:hypothetical protein